MIPSPVFGPFDPTAPAAPAGFGGGVVVAEPVLVRAPPSVVWEVLTDFAAYPAWNPLNRSFACEGEVGATATFGVAWGPYDGPLAEPTLTMRERVTVWAPERCFGYADDRGRWHRAERLQVLTATPEGTRYQTWERWQGWITPLISALYADRMRVGFRAAGLAVRARAEALAVAPPRARRTP
jgi:hypothetical protein